MKVFTTHLIHNLIVKMMKMKIKKKQQQNNNIDTKLPKVFDYLKSLNQEAKDLMDEIEDADDGIDLYKFVFIGRNREKFNFNIFRKPLNFLSAIYNGEIALKRAEIFQRYLDKKIEKLKFNYKAKNVKEKEEIDKVLMHANDLLKYRDKIIEAFKEGTFSSEHLEKSHGAAHDYVLENGNDFIHKIKSMTENTNLSLFSEFFELSPADYAKKIIKVKDPDENKEIVAEKKDNIRFKRQNKRNERNRKKNENMDETLKIIEEILDYNKNAQKNLSVASRVDKGKSEPKPEESIVKRVVLRRGKVAKIKREEKNINNKLFKEYFTIYQSPSHMYKK